MKPDINISHADKLITTSFSGVMTASDMQGYFENFITNIPEGAGYREVVDFTRITDFEINNEAFKEFSVKAAKIFSTGRVKVTEFIISNELQLGMARMFSSMASEGDVKFIFTKKNWS